MGAINALGNPGFVATATIHVSRVIKGAAITGGTAPASPGLLGAAECGTTDQPLGVSFESPFDPPGLSGSDPTIAARQYDPLRVYGDNNICWVLVSSTGLAVTAGQRLTVVTSDGQVGPIIFTTGHSGQWVIGQALEDGLPGKLVRVAISISQIANPQS